MKTLIVNIDQAAQVIAQLVREGVTFEAVQSTDGYTILITFTGGY